MRFLFLVFISIIILTSCRDFEFTQKTENQLPPRSAESKHYMYFGKSESFLDSSTYIGTLNVKILNRYWDPDNLYNELGIFVKRAGGNVVILDKSEKRDYILEGKMYLIKDYEETGYTEDSLKKIWQERKPDKLEGLYITDLSGWGDWYRGLLTKYGIIRKDSSNYLMVYINGFEHLNYNFVSKIWDEGDVMAYITTTEKPTLFKARNYEESKIMNENSMLKIDNGNIRITNTKGWDIYRKVYPDSSQFESLYNSLSGFAIGNNRILTSYHGVKDLEKDNKIIIKGINGDFDTRYEAVVDKFDKTNDIAILKLVDSTVLLNCKFLPLTEGTKLTGEEVFILGYPIASILGDEIKLTNGIISSTSGYSGDMNSYQVTAPIQPGNSGSPLFDNNGNLIGLVTSGIGKADNVGYSLKLKQIKEFLGKSGHKLEYLPENTYKDQALSEKVKNLQNSVFLIEVINTTPMYIKEKKTTGRNSWGSN